MILFENIHKKYGARVVLDDIHLAIEGGEFVSLIGPSGAGKTTLINLLIGAEKPDVGTISVDDYDITAMDSATLQHYRRRIGIVFQENQLLPRKTVYENIAFVLEVCGKSDDEIRIRVPEALDMVGMLAHQDYFPDHLSGGEIQKASIARAIVHDPPLLIADEPTGNLDPNATREIITILMNIHEHGKTVLLASHDHEMVNFVRQRVVMLNLGKIVSDKNEGDYDLDLLKEIVGASHYEIHIDAETDDLL